MNIKSKSQIVFGFQATAKQVQEFYEQQEDFVNLNVYNELDDVGFKIIGLLITQTESPYSYSEAQKFNLLSSNKEQEIIELFQKHFQQEASYFLVSSCPE